ncbi:S41 family peptidase [Psychroserpens ponticola]|uniref:S41 family peptidase n=1 Tax=Psychroserpens ponticola TaxID=2932268 RepID=A0ABY7S1F6_9FLAO|nr:S41 family peptidase [Psychroserpens ponticola]WCO03219.1 S41 family peptidase [Psychroserpens ponticola]
MKISTAICIIFLFTVASAFSQSHTCDCKTDLDFIVQKIKKMPSYKKQIKGEKATQFTNSYHTLSTKMQQPILIEDCYKMLLKQMSFINDNHASIKVNEIYLSEEDSKDEIKLAAFKATERYKNHPRTTRNLSELQEELSKKALEDIEGIYDYYGDEQKIGIYYAGNQKDLIGVVLESSLNQWEAGEIRFYATHTTGHKYNVYHYDRITRTPSQVKSFTFENGRLWSYKKEGNTDNNEFRDASLPQLDFKQINENTQYLYFGDFSNSKKSEHQKFFKDVENKLTAENVIVDLRSNSGGNKKFSDPFLKLLKNKNIYVLTNCFTGSNGEQFTVKLKNLKNTQHLGQATFGIIAYGLNYGRSYDTPSGYFRITPTDMNFHEFYEYEGKGITPEIALDFDSDWINQTLTIIGNNK